MSKINVFPPSFEYDMFYISYPFVTYLLALLRITRMPQSIVIKLGTHIMPPAVSPRPIS
jgi:hypothetical protein